VVLHKHGNYEQQGGDYNRRYLLLHAVVMMLMMMVMLVRAALMVVVMMNVCHNFVRFYLFPGAKLRHTPCNLVAKLLFALRKYILR
jgi:hypothetical protein